MKEMKTKNYIVIAFLILTFLGCNEILKETPRSFFEEQNSFNTDKDATAALNGVYNRLKGVYGMNMVNLADISGEECSVEQFNATVYDIEVNAYTSATGTFDGFYTNAYTLIDRANRVVANVPNISMNATLKAQIIGEAKFLRALTYFNLVQAFGDVPLVLEVPKSVVDVKIERTAYQTVYEQIIADLKEAETSLPLKYTVAGEVGRATSGAAKSILAKVYLTKKDWTNAAAKAKEVIDSKAYSLVPDYKDIFTPEKKNGVEHIFSVQYSCLLQAYGSPMANNFAVMFSYMNMNGGFYHVTNYFANSYLAGDYRKLVTVIDQKVNPTNNILYKSTLGLLHCDKYWDPSPCGIDQARNNFMVIRYADVLLMYAEASNELNGPTTDAYSAINLVRARARNGVATAQPQDLSGLTKEQFRAAVLQERSWELCFEGHRRWDLLRTGKYIETMTKAGIQVSEKNLLYPIPANEIDVNPALKQNPGF